MNNFRTVSKIIIYYTDGTFEEVNNKYHFPPMPNPNTSPWPAPMPPTGPYTLNNTCSACGMKFDGPMGYACSRPDCPSGVSYCGTEVK